MESPVSSRHSPRRRGIVPAEAGSAANECWMLDVELIGVFDRINRICRIYRIGSQGSAVALRAMAGQGGGACQESVGRGSAAGTLSRMVQP
jgi:hypothetical protein